MDTLKNSAGFAAGIPDGGTRVIILVAVLFVLSILGVLLVARMREADEEAKK